MRKISEQALFSSLEISVLRCLSGKKSGNSFSAEITEISQSTGIRDSEEVLRALYTLEGKSLVEPNPRGDFTSHNWQITDTGVRALNFLENRV